VCFRSWCVDSVTVSKQDRSTCEGFDNIQFIVEAASIEGGMRKAVKLTGARDLLNWPTSTRHCS
jgi:hypothetical protein